MTLADVAQAMSWAAALGWNPGKFDAECYAEVDPHGFFICELDGEPVGCVSAVAYNESYGFLGMYLVKPEIRNRQAGLLLGLAAKRYLGNRIIGADSVLERIDNYKRMGGKLAYHHWRYEATGGGEVPDGVVDLNAVPFTTLLAYDNQLFPAPRPNFLRRWIAQPESAAYGVMTGDRLAGYGVIRACLTGYKIGPLFADTPESAELIYRALAARVPGQQIYLDIPEPNAAAQQLVERYQMTKVFVTGRLYNKEVPLPLDRIYAITSLELG